jgi:glycosyltransferase involved in cell wall biosynthesis
MKVLLHDFVGHPFPITLTHALARRGHMVDHVYFASETGPKGDYSTAALVHPNARFHGLSIAGRYRKDSLISRRRNDLDYAGQAAALIERLKPDVILSGNAPTEVQDRLMRAGRRAGSAFAYWMQDFYSIAITKLMKKKLGPIGAMIGGYYRYLDRRHLRRSDAIVLITEDFRPLAASWSGAPERIHVVENWGVLEEILPGARDNRWSRRMEIADGFNFLYSGTLGLKHNPALLAALAEAAAGAARVVVICSGASVPYLEQEKAKRGLENLVLLPLQPFADFSDVLASADVLVAVIEPDAGTFSVPSKVLSYMCAGKPVLLAAPAENLAARIVARENAGVVVSPEDEAGFVAAGLALMRDRGRDALGRNGRAYAVAHFEIEAIADRFEAILSGAIAHRRREIDA